ncbi:MAG: helix-turn-helix domain-containing protein [Clostridiales bacterium]|jgi:transcriptional regulator with XRE-family HTH domain|nr:helix-turn-helix domain-containing protein [Clostridiales bacterium]
MFNEKLKNLRRNKNMTQQDLAEALGIDRTTVTKYESKNVTPPIASVRKICEFFGVSMDFMLGTESTDELAKRILDKRVLILQRAASENNLTQNELQDILNYAMYRFPGKFKGLEVNENNTLQ